MLSVCLASGVVNFEKLQNLAKLGDGLDESPTVMVGETNKTKQKRKLGKNRGILKPSWAFR